MTRSFEQYQREKEIEAYSFIATLFEADIRSPLETLLLMSFNQDPPNPPPELGELVLVPSDEFAGSYTDELGNPLTFIDELTGEETTWLDAMAELWQEFAPAGLVNLVVAGEGEE